jgi:hypothetical protein
MPIASSVALFCSLLRAPATAMLGMAADASAANMRLRR